MKASFYLTTAAVINVRIKRAKQTDMRTDRQRHTDRQTKRHTDRKTEKHTGRKTYGLAYPADESFPHHSGGTVNGWKDSHDGVLGKIASASEHQSGL